MMNKEKTLFIFEGAKTEDKLVEKLERNFLGGRHAIKCVFDAEIYQLYRIIKEEKEFSLDIVSVLKERTAENAEILKDYNRDSFAYIYLFFDYDATPHWQMTIRLKKCLPFSMMKLRKECFTSVIQWWKPYGILRIWKVSSH